MADSTIAPSQAELILRAILEGMPDVVFFVKDVQGKYIVANEATAAWFNLSVEDLIGHDDSDLFPPAVAARIQADDRQVLETGTAVRFKEDLWRDGQRHILLTTKFPWHGRNRQQLGVIGLCRDVTESDQEDRGLRQRDALNQAIFVALPDEIIRMDAKGTYLDVKAGNFGLTQSPAEMIGQNVRTILSPEAAEQRLAAAAKALATGEMQRYEFELERAGQRYWREVCVMPIARQEVLVSIRDFSHLRQAEAALTRTLQAERAARHRAERASRVKDEFLAVLSHELRSPLNPILGWASLLKRGQLSPEKMVVAAQTIERNARLQAQLIDDLLDIAKMLRGKLELVVEPVNLRVTIVQALETVQLAAQAKSLHVVTQLADDLVVQGDPTRLQQMVWNLLSNAVKFTPAGGQITIGLAEVERQAQIQVTDTGVGILPQFLPYVFERFCQEDSDRSGQFGGLGLGLAIVRQLTELHGGTVRVESLGQNQGATFMIRLPLAPGAMPVSSGALPNRSAYNLAGLNVLVVDDQADSRTLLVAILSQADATVIEATSGHDCLRQLEQVRPDLLICDIGMPELDGYQLIRQIRQRPLGQSRELIAIALTAYAGETYHRRALAAGFQAYLPKPIDIDHLLTTINDLVHLS